MALVAPAGRGIDRRRDCPDPRDYRYSKVHRAHAPIERKVDLSPGLPLPWDQGGEATSAAHAAAALACYLWPSAAPQEVLDEVLYWCSRYQCEVARSPSTQVRDVMRVTRHIRCRCPLAAADRCRIATYSRLVQTSSYLDCLASGYPFVLGFEAFESLYSDDVARSGVMRIPSSDEAAVGGHAVLVVGYDLDFRQSRALADSGLDPALVSDRALFARNSWGPDWGIGGYFWMPLEHATNPSTGGDAWTGRL